MTDTHERLIAILVQAHKLTPDRLGLDAPLEGLGIDSLGVIELLWDVEDKFQVTLPTDPAGLLTVGDVVRQIDALQGQRAPALRLASGGSVADGPP